MYGMMVLSKEPSCQHQQEYRVQQQGVVNCRLQKTYAQSTTNVGSVTEIQKSLEDLTIGGNEKHTPFTKLGDGYSAIVYKVFVLSGKKIFGSLSRMLGQNQTVISLLASIRAVSTRRAMWYGRLEQRVLMNGVKVMPLNNVSGELITLEELNLQSSKVHTASLLTTMKLFSKIKTMLAQFVMVKRDQYKQMANRLAWLSTIITKQIKCAAFSVHTAIEGLGFSKTAFCGYAPQLIT